MDRESIITMLSRHIYLERWAGSDNEHIRRQLEQDWPPDIVDAAFVAAHAAIEVPGRAQRPGSPRTS
jgi:hypothetical protein